jgi:hypothetical protein
MPKTESFRRGWPNRTFKLSTDNRAIRTRMHAQGGFLIRCSSVNGVRIFLLDPRCSAPSDAHFAIPLRSRRDVGGGTAGVRNCQRPQPRPLRRVPSRAAPGYLLCRAYNGLACSVKQQKQRRRRSTTTRCCVRVRAGCRGCTGKRAMAGKGHSTTHIEYNLVLRTASGISSFKTEGLF